MLYTISVSKYNKDTQEYPAPNIVAICKSWEQVLHELKNINIKYSGECVVINNETEE